MTKPSDDFVLLTVTVLVDRITHPIIVVVIFLKQSVSSIRGTVPPGFFSSNHSGLSAKFIFTSSCLINTHASRSREVEHDNVQLKDWNLSFC